MTNIVSNIFYLDYNLNLQFNIFLHLTKILTPKFLIKYSDSYFAYFNFSVSVYPKKFLFWRALIPLINFIFSQKYKRT